MHPRRRFTVPLPDGRTLALGERTLVMGILNVTPDSFSDGGALLERRRGGRRRRADGGRRRRPARRRRRVHAARARRRSPRPRSCAACSRSIEALAGARPGADLHRHLQGGGGRRRRSRRARRSSTTSAGCATTRAGRGGGQPRLPIIADAHARAVRRHVPAGHLPRRRGRGARRAARERRVRGRRRHARRGRARRSRARASRRTRPTASRCWPRCAEFAELGRPVVIGPVAQVVPRAADSRARRSTPTSSGRPASP